MRLSFNNLPLLLLCLHLTACSTKNDAIEERKEQRQEALFAKLGIAADYSTVWLDSAALFLESAAIESTDQLKLSTAFRDLGWRYCDRNDFGTAMLRFQSALQIAENTQDPIQIAEALLAIGSIYQKFQGSNDAIQHFHRALEYAGKTQNNNLVARAYHELAKSKIAMKEYDEAITLAQYGLQLSNITEEGWKVQLQNDIGVCHMRQEQYKAAEVAFETALALAGNNEYAKGYVYGNLGSIYNLSGQQEKALLYLQRDRDISLQFADYPSAASASLEIAEVFVQMKAFEKARESFLLADSLFHLDPTRPFIAGHYESWLKLINQLTTPKEQVMHLALLCEKLNNILQKETQTNNLQIISISNIVKATNERNAEALAVLKKAKNQTNFLNIVLVFIMALILTSSALLYRNKTLAQKHQVSTLQLDTQEKELKIAYQERQLQVAELNLQKEIAQNQLHQIEQIKHSFTQTQLSKSLAEEIIFHLSDAVENVLKTEKNIQPITRKKLESSLKTLSHVKGNTIGTASDSQEMHLDFAYKIQQQYPELTNDEIKLCTYLRMNMSTKEIARIKMITVAGVNKSRNRLRKKIGLDPSVDLMKFLSSI